VSITKIDRDSALVVVDMQKGILAMAPSAEVAGAVGKTAELANTFRELKLPVIWVCSLGLPKGRVEFSLPATTPPSDFAEFHEDLPVRDGDLKISKRATSAFVSQDLRAHLKDHGTTNVIVAGIALAIGVESTVRDGFDAGYSMTVAIDATIDPMPGRAEAALKFTLPMLCEAGDTAEIVSALRNAQA